MKTKEEQQQENDLYAEFLLEDCKINPQEEMDYPPIALSYGSHTYRTINGEVEYPTPIATYGNFSFIQAPPKHKKTFLVSLLSAAYLNGQTNFSGGLRGHRDDKCLLHFDTEQGDFDAHKTFKRVVEMCEDDSQCYQTFGLRKLSFRERALTIDFAIRTTPNLGLVIIDGIADLISDVNDINQTNRLMDRVLYWTKEFKCHIMTVIHTNYDSDKPTGHLGSAMSKKAETQMHLSKSENNPNVINVSCKSSRSRAFEDFGFYVNRVGYPQLADDQFAGEIEDFLG